MSNCPTEISICPGSGSSAAMPTSEKINSEASGRRKKRNDFIVIRILGKRTEGKKLTEFNKSANEFARQYNSRHAMIIDTFTGGIFDTNCYFLPETGILIDAPQECAEWLQASGYRVQLLL